MAEAIKKADILIGLSVAGLFKPEHIKSMNVRPIVFALANPEPEISRKEALKGGAAVYASGSSEDTNQINNALIFPGLFRGLLDGRRKKISSQLKIKTAMNVAARVKKPVAGKFMPSVLDKKLVEIIAGTVY